MVQMLEPTRTALDLFNQTRRRGVAVALLARREWSGMNPHGDWEAQWLKALPRVSALVTVAQHAAAADGAASVPATLLEQGFPEPQLGAVDPRGFAGWVESADGQARVPLQTKLFEPVLRARQATGAEQDMLATGRLHLELLVRGAVAEAAAQASQAQLVGTKRTVAVWLDPPPYCQRCAVVTGRRVKPTTQFSRHKNCDGQVTVMSERDKRAGWGLDESKVTDLTDAQRRAIADGADTYQVINAKTALFNRRAGGKTGLTDDGLRTYSTRSHKTTKNKDPRLTPKGIYAQAGDDRAKAVELLRANGYILH